MMRELERERALLQAEKIHNRVTSEVRQEEVDDQLKRLLDMSLRGIITDEEYKQKKAELINRKFDISAKGDTNGDWLEHFKNFLSLAHQASYIAAGANPANQRDFLQKIVSNLKLYNKTLVVSYSSDFRFMAENRHLEMGSSRMSRGKTALNFTQVDYTAIPILSSIFWTLEILFLDGLSPWWRT